MWRFKNGNPKGAFLLVTSVYEVVNYFFAFRCNYMREKESMGASRMSGYFYTS